MTLAIGQTLSHYEVLAPLGAGAMGEVYRARDSRLEREVALKVLPEELADDPGRLQRFQREAKALASLNHPNVAQVYEVDRAGDTPFIAMELVPGEDLAARLARGPMPAPEAIEVCRQIAEGLEAAHEAGVIHRDLKPANVRVTPEGIAKILDFGLAKAIPPRASREGATLAESDSVLRTEEGAVLGTPAYMSPEQARGLPVDRRADIWALGCLLFECLAGGRAFGGESLTDVLALIVGKEPDWSRLPAIPPRVGELLRRMLSKDPRVRLRDAGEARVHLTLAREEPVRSPADGGTGSLRTGSKRGVGLVAGLAAATCLGGYWIGRRAITNPEGTSAGRSFHGIVQEFGPETILHQVTISPDGARIAWLDGDGLHVRPLGGRERRTVVADRGLGGQFTWSPDGRELAFVDEGGLWKVGVEEGTPRRISDFDGWPWTTLRWSEEAGVAYFTREGIVGVSADGERSVLVETDPQIAHLHDFILLSGGRAALVVPHVVGGGAETIELLQEGKRRRLDATPGLEPNLVAFEPDGDLLWMAGDRVWRTPLSVDDFEPRGEPRLVLENVVQASLSGDGVLAYVEREGEASSQLGWVERDDGRFVPFGSTHPNIWGGNLSWDRTRVLFTVNGGGKSETWIHDLGRDVSTPWIRREDGHAFPLPFHDGRIGIVPVTTERGTYVYPRSGKGEPEVLDGIALEVSPGVRVVREFPLFGPGATHLRGPGVEGGERLLLNGEHSELVQYFSQDGDWMLYSSERTGKTQIYLTRFPSVDGEEWPVSAEGGEDAWFGKETDEILFRSESVVYRVSLQTAPEVRVGRPEPLFPLSPGISLTDYDGSDRFVGVRIREGVRKVYVDTGGAE